MLEGLGRGGDAFEVRAGRAAGVRVERERLAHGDHPLGDAVVEGALRQGQRRVLGPALLSGAVAHHQAELHLQAGPGVGGQVGLGGAARLLVLVAARQGQFERQRRRARPGLQPRFGAERGKAPVVLRLPRQARPEAPLDAAGRFGEGGGRRRVGLHGQRPGGEGLVLAADHQLAAGLERRFGQEVGAVQRAEGDVAGVGGELRRGAAAAGDRHLQAAALRDGGGAAGRVEEDRRGAGVGGRRHPRFQLLRRRGRRPLELRQHRAA